MLAFKKWLLWLAPLLALAWGTSPPNYSGSTSPAISLDVVSLQPQKEDRDFDGKIFPGENATIELSCRVPPETVMYALNPTSYKLKWILPNEKMIEEGRVFTKTDSNYHIYLKTSEFGPEDGGKYICRLEVDGEDRGYEESIEIPSLDGTPIIKCTVGCERNTDEKCQVLEYVSVGCKAWGFAQLTVYCSFSECENREDCVTGLLPIYPGYYYLGTSYVEETRKAFDDYGTISGLYTCRASNEKGDTDAELYVPISSGSLKPNARNSYVRQQTISQGGIDKNFSGRQPKFYRVDEEIKLNCFTNADVDGIEWFYYNSSSPAEAVSVSNDTYEGIYVSETSSSEGHVSQVIIRQYDFFQGGKYECKIKVGEGEEYKQEFALETHRWAADSNMNDYNHIFAKVGSRVVLRCSTDSVLDEPDVYWKKDGSEEDVNSNFGRYDIHNNAVELTINSATLEDSGVYTCLSRKSIGIEQYDLNGRATVTITQDGVATGHQGTGGDISFDKGDIVDNIITALGTIQENLKALSAVLKKE